MYFSPANQTALKAEPVSMPMSSLVECNTHDQALCTHEELFCEGDKVEFFYEVVDGVLCNYRMLLDGRRQIISFAHPGDLIGLGQDGAYRYSCEAVCRSKVRSISSCAVMRDARKHAGLGHRLLLSASAELARMQEHQLLLGRKTAIEKLASFLMMLAGRYSRDGTQQTYFDLCMTRTDIADYLGLTIETVSRNMTKLKHSGIIELPEATIVHVRDMNKLAELASGDEGLS